MCSFASVCSCPYSSLWSSARWCIPPPLTPPTPTTRPLTAYFPPPPQVWSDVEQTLIPSLVRHVQRAALVRRKALSLRRCEAMHRHVLGILKLLEHEHQLPLATRDAAKATFEAQAAELSTKLEACAAAAEGRVQLAFDTQVAPQLEMGAESSMQGALATTQQWGTSVMEGGMHWATYKATTRRHGVFRINMNEQLVAPIFKAVSTHWEKARRLVDRPR